LLRFAGGDEAKKHGGKQAVVAFIAFGAQRFAFGDKSKGKGVYYSTF
jgi:hypothetical protein